MKKLFIKLLTILLVVGSTLVINTNEILAEGIDISDATVTFVGGETHFEYADGAEIKPTVIVTYNDVTLIKDTDYTVTYTGDNKYPTTAPNYPKVIITGIGSYTGTKSVNYAIIGKQSFLREGYEGVVKTGLVYNGENQELLQTLPETDCGTIRYFVTNDSTAKATMDNYERDKDYVPVAKNADTYYVWVYLKGDDGYANNSIKIGEVTIDKATPVVTAPVGKADLVYNKNEQALLATDATTTGGTLMYKVDYQDNIGSDPIEGTYSTNSPVGEHAGTYTVKYKVVEDDNYYSVSEASITVTIAKANPEITTLPDEIEGLSYTGTAQYLISEGVTTGGTLKYKVDYQDNEGGALVTGSYSDVRPSATKAGTYSIKYKVFGNNNYNDSGESTLNNVVIAKVDPTYTAPTNKDLTYTGNAQELITTGSTEHGDFKYSTTTGETKTWSDVVPTGTDAGDYSVWFKLIGDNNHNDVTSTAVENVKIKKQEVTEPTIASQVYTGSVLTADVDLDHALYKVNTAEEDRKGIAVKSYPIIFELRDPSNYKWSSTDQTTVTVNFNITQKSYTDASGVTLDTTSYTYDGAEHHPTVTVTDGTLTVSTNDYTVEYSSDCTNVGTKKVTVTFKNNYSGTIEKEFTITPVDINDITLTYTKDSYTYTGSDIAPEFSLNTTLSTGAYQLQATDYTVTYSKNHKDVADSPIGFTITGKGNYTGTINKTFSITPKSLADDEIVIASADLNKLYTGAPITVSLTVTDGTNGTLVENKDYTVTYPDDHTNAGQVTLTIAGKGNYTGTYNKSFTIDQRPIVETDITVGDAEYNYGTAVIPNVIVKYQTSTVLVAGTDYTVSYTNNINAGTATATITGKGNYKTASPIDKNFTITPVALTDEDISNINESYVYTESAITPDPTITHNEKVLAKDTDYEVSYSNNTDVSTDITKAEVIVTGKGNFSGNISKKFNINAATPDNLTVTFDNATGLVYNGNAYEPTLTVKNGAVTLQADTDYTVTYANNVNRTITGKQAIAKLTLSRTGYSGVKEYYFDIAAKSINHSDVEASVVQSSEYTGSEIKPIVTITDKQSGTATPLSANDYELTYTDNIVVGTNTGKVKITGKNNYEGTIDLKFSITAKSVTKLSIELPQTTYVHTGEEIKPEPIVKDGSKDLVKDTDYTVSYSDNIAIGENAKVKITGKGNYSEYKEVTFEIADIAANAVQDTDGNITITCDGDTSGFLADLETVNDTDPATTYIEFDFGGTIGTVKIYNTETDKPIKVEDNKIVIDYSLISDKNKDFTKGDAFVAKLVTASKTKQCNVTSKRGVETIDVASVKNGVESTVIYVDGQAITGTSVTINDGRDRIVQTYGFNKTTGDKHEQYPTEVNVYRITQENGWASLKQLSGLKNVMNYAGTSIRMNGYKGIRIFTCVYEDMKTQLLSSAGLEGYNLLEYGTVLAWDENLNGKEPVLVQKANGSFAGDTNCGFGYAYKKGVMDAVYSKSSGSILYTNVMVDKNNAWTGKYGKDFAMRSYMILRPVGATDSSQDVVVYGGTLHRSIAYVASQVIGNYAVGSSTYNYLYSLINYEQQQ